MSATERKAARIQPFVVPCRCAVGETRLPGFLTDISTRGCRIHTDVAPPAAGTAVVLEVRLGRQATHLRIPGTVRWARPSSRGGSVFGLSFDGVGPEVQQVIDGVVEEFRRRAASIE